MTYRLRIRNWTSHLTESIYVRVMSQKHFERLNNRMLNLTLHARGYQNHGSSEKTGEKYFLKALKNLDIQVALDIGANVGEYSRLLIDELNCKVIAFEPMDYGCKELSRVKLNHPEKLNFFQIALSDKDESKEISYSKGLGELATLVESNMELNFVSNQNTEKMLIQASRLDSIQQVYPELFPRVDFIKIDVEGHEYAVITGANETISKFKPKLIQIEFNIYNLFAEISLLKIAKLLPDYSLFQLLPGKAGLAERDPRDPLTNLCYYSNFVFALKGLKI